MSIEQPTANADAVRIQIHRSPEATTEADPYRSSVHETCFGEAYWSLDLLLHRVSSTESSVEDSDEGLPLNLQNLNAADAPSLLFLAQCIEPMQITTSKTGDVQRTAVIRFIFAFMDGQIARCDFLERRMECCEHIAKTVSFLSPLQKISGITPFQVTPDCLLSTLPSAIGGMFIQDPGSTDAKATLQELDCEMKNRLSFHWLVPGAVSRKRVAWVQGREDIESSRSAYEAAWALGISLVIIDQTGHWLQDDNGPYAYLREAFIPVNIEVDVSFPQRVIDAVRDYPEPIHGLVTISDVRLAGIAKACEILGLPTSPSDAFLIAGDKARSRMLEPDCNESFSLSTAEEMPAFLDNHRGMPLHFPLIVKPCLGWNSDCVSKVTNEVELIEAIHKASERHAGATAPRTAVIVEPYIGGPEVDANFVLLEGEILFFEISDDFPSNADADDATHQDHFQETQILFPTALPEREVAALRDSLHRSILRQGFTSGVFHCEARIRNSRVQYTVQDGILDLEEKTEPPSGEVSVYLLENNARPPGYLETVAVHLNYGVDYYALQLLFSLGSTESARIRALAQPFTNGPQFTLSAMIIQQTRAGIMKTADAGEEFLRSHPHMRDQIPNFKTQKKGGDVLEGPLASSLWWIANFSVFSRVSRRDCLKLVEYIRQNFSYEVE